MPNNIPIVFTFDRKCAWPAAVALQSLLDSASENTVYDIHVLHPDLSQAMIDGFLKITGRSGHKLTFHFVGKDRFRNVPANGGSWGPIVYYRLLIPEILADCDKAIYSDIDVFFKKDLSALFATDIENFEVGAIAGEVNAPDTICHKYFPENKKSVIYMSGFLLMNLKRMRAEQTVSKFFETIRQFGPRLKMFDLDVLNLTCTRICPLPFDYAVLEAVYALGNLKDAKDYRWLCRIYSDEQLLAARRDPAIIHYAGELGKPWRRADVPAYYQSYLDAVPPELRVRTLRDIRKTWISKIFGRKKQRSER